MEFVGSILEERAGVFFVSFHFESSMFCWFCTKLHSI